MCVRTNKDIAPEPLAPASSRCTHNDWDNLRVKCQKTHLRCRVCSGKWNVILEACDKCSKFPKGNCTDPTCTLLHIHAYKSKVKEDAFMEKQRRKTHPERAGAVPPLPTPQARTFAAPEEMPYIPAYRSETQEVPLQTKQGQMREPPVAVMPTTVLPTAHPATLQMAVVPEADLQRKVLAAQYMGVAPTQAVQPFQMQFVDEAAYQNMLLQQLALQSQMNQQQQMRAHQAQQQQIFLQQQALGAQPMMFLVSPVVAYKP